MEKEKSMHWNELVEKADPTLKTKPVVTYVFNKGERVFHKERKGSGTRKV
tara:strand:+ start:115 stop:264 length:150 start_codon:yes stop_codon:yes gene_type:complete